MDGVPPSEVGTGLDEEEEEELDVVVGCGALGALVGTACVEDMACFTCVKTKAKKKKMTKAKKMQMDKHTPVRPDVYKLDMDI